jgi:hypothetical protein
MPPSAATANDTTGLKRAPEIRPNIKMMTNRPVGCGAALHGDHHQQRAENHAADERQRGRAHDGAVRAVAEHGPMPAAVRPA